MSHLKRKHTRPLDRIKRWFMVGIILLVIFSILMVEISYIFM
jgi:hypothetical protein